MPSTETGHGSSGQHIVSSALSKDSPNLLWVASSDGRIFCIDWTTGSGVDTPYRVTAILDMTVASVQVGKTTEDVLLVLEKTGVSGGRIRAYNRQALDSGTTGTTTGTLLYNCSDWPQLLRSASDASVIVVGGGNSIHVGSLSTGSTDIKTLADLKYRFFAFNVEEAVTTVDMRCQVRPAKKNSNGPRPADLAIGCVNGRIFVFRDVVARSPAATISTPRKGGSLQPVKYHWHRRAVHSLKWSHDGKKRTRKERTAHD
jgi:NET1-associated nuclear protein 1 (U3 small nucleolar RNA-associated protein 17)